MAGSLRITQIRSTIGHIARNRATIKALGLHGIGSSVDVVDNEATRGMARQVRFLVSVEERSTTGAHHAAAQAGSGQGGAEHASERTPVRERAPGGVNEDQSRLSGAEEKA